MKNEDDALCVTGHVGVENQSLVELQAAAASSMSYREIRIRRIDFDTTLAAMLVDIFQNSKHDLKHLEISQCNHHVDNIIAMALSISMCLETLRLVSSVGDCWERTPRSIGVFLRTRACKLRNLDILETNLSLDAISSLEQGICGNSTLQRLQFKSCRFTLSRRSAFHELARAIGRRRNMKEVHFESCLIRTGQRAQDDCPASDAVTAELIDCLQGNPQLMKLNVSANGCHNVAVSSVAALMDRSPLVHIDLSRQKAGDHLESIDLSPLVGAIGRSSTLGTLELNYCKLGSETNMACLAAALMHNTSVKRLGLAGNGITNSGMEIFASRVGSMGSLELLLLSDNPFDDEGAQTLATAMEENYSITEVVCSSTLGSFKKIQYFADLNYAGRQWVKTFASIRPSIWPVILSRAAARTADDTSLTRQADAFYLLLRHAPASLFLQSQRKRTSKKLWSGNKQKEANKARDRLLSIYRDAMEIQEVFPTKLPSQVGCLPLVVNERCGAWYVQRPSASCYFKSTDGHVNVWDFSLKRLNLPFLYNVLCKSGGCVVVDSSVRKLLPDSFSRTIPIWAAVMNRILLKYTRECGMVTTTDSGSWDSKLCTPAGIVPKAEHDKICERVESHVESLYRSRAIVDIERFVREFTKPIRVVWMNHEGTRYLANDEPIADVLSGESLLLVCWNPSRYKVCDTYGSLEDRTAWRAVAAEEAITKNHVQWMTRDKYRYTPGAADDHESWARRLTPPLFWEHREILVDPFNSDSQVEGMVEKLVAGTQSEFSIKNDRMKPLEDVSLLCSRISGLNIWIGSRRAGRPPECWKYFDAVLNVTTMNYQNQKNRMDGKFYLQLPVEEGKKDKTLLEKYMPVGLAFLVYHLQHGRRVLVHCAQGKDRSVAMVLVFICLTSPLTFPVALRHDFCFWDFQAIVETVNGATNCDTAGCNAELTSMNSGLPFHLVTRLLERDGGEVFLRWVHTQSGRDTVDGPLADKESVRVALHLIRQDREAAEPTRATMQKINRFLMSNSLYRGES